MAKKKLLTLEVEFPRSWEDVGPEGEPLHCVTQPYITGLYLAINSEKSRVAQLSIPYSKLNKFVKQLKDSSTVKDLYICALGSFLDQSELDLINS